MNTQADSNQKHQGLFNLGLVREFLIFILEQLGDIYNAK